MTHILQPLDASVYKPLQNHFSNITDLIILVGVMRKQNIQINKTNFPIVFKEAYEKSITMSTIKSGFHAKSKFNQNAILKDRLMPSESPVDGSANEQDIVKNQLQPKMWIWKFKPTHESNPSTSQLELQGKPNHPINHPTTSSCHHWSNTSNLSRYFTYSLSQK